MLQNKKMGDVGVAPARYLTPDTRRGSLLALRTAVAEVTRHIPRPIGDAFIATLCRSTVSMASAALGSLESKSELEIDHARRIVLGRAELADVDYTVGSRGTGGGAA